MIEAIIFPMHSWDFLQCSFALVLDNLLIITVRDHLLLMLYFRPDIGKRRVHKGTRLRPAMRPFLIIHMIFLSRINFIVISATTQLMHSFRILQRIIITLRYFRSKFITILMVLLTIFISLFDIMHSLLVLNFPLLHYLV